MAIRSGARAEGEALSGPKDADAPRPTHQRTWPGTDRTRRPLGAGSFHRDGGHGPATRPPRTGTADTGWYARRPEPNTVAAFRGPDGAARLDGGFHGPLCDARRPHRPWPFVGAGRARGSWSREPLGSTHEPPRMGSTGRPRRCRTAVPLLTSSSRWRPLTRARARGASWSVPPSGPASGTASLAVPRRPSRSVALGQSGARPAAPVLGAM